jgi:hypothetical protein
MFPFSKVRNWKDPDKNPDFANMHCGHIAKAVQKALQIYKISSCHLQILGDRGMI